MYCETQCLAKLRGTVRGTYVCIVRPRARHVCMHFEAQCEARMYVREMGSGYALWSFSFYFGIYLDDANFDLLI